MRRRRAGASADGAPRVVSCRGCMKAEIRSTRPAVKLVPGGCLARDGRRLDCGPYMSGALEAKVLLDGLRATKVPLEDVCLNRRGGLVNAGRIKRLWVDDERYGIRFLSSTDILK